MADKDKYHVHIPSECPWHYSQRELVKAIPNNKEMSYSKLEKLVRKRLKKIAKGDKSKADFKAEATRVIRDMHKCGLFKLRGETYCSSYWTFNHEEAMKQIESFEKFLYLEDWTDRFSIL